MPMKQIKISEKVYDELKSLMLDRETFNIAIQRLINDNKSTIFYTRTIEENFNFVF